eukprot:2652172-Rhodomonas_salina.1
MYVTPSELLRAALTGYEKGESFHYMERSSGSNATGAYSGVPAGSKLKALSCSNVISKRRFCLLLFIHPEWGARFEGAREIPRPRSRTPSIWIRTQPVTVGYPWLPGSRQSDSSSWRMASYEGQRFNRKGTFKPYQGFRTPLPETPPSEKPLKSLFGSKRKTERESGKEKKDPDAAHRDGDRSERFDPQDSQTPTKSFNRTPANANHLAPKSSA